MIGAMSAYATYFLWVVAVTAFTTFGVPLLFVPLTYGRIKGWKLPEEKSFTIYVGRVYGGVICVIAIFGAWATTNPMFLAFFYRQLFILFCSMMSVHIWSAVTGTNSKVANFEIGFWGFLAVATLIFMPPIPGA